MDITKKIKEELEDRMDRIEDFIAKKGLGSKQLKKAQKAQRNINLGLVMVGVVAIAGLAMWMKSTNKED
jgi:ribosome-associated translation inhibitor RaiA